MNDTERQQLMDGLDRRLALGEIDLGTYNSLRGKFSMPAPASHGSDPLPGIMASLPKEAVAINCPGCMAPLPLPGDPLATSVVCGYCGGTFALQAAASEMESLKSGIRKWISEVAGAGGGGSMVDETSRSFIFRDKLLPSLKMAADRATEIFAIGKHQALFAFPLVDHLNTSAFRQALRSTPEVGPMVEKIKTIIARVQSAEVQIFAIGPSEKGELALLELQCQETIYLANARKQLAHYTTEGLRKASANLGAVESMCSNPGVNTTGPGSARAMFAGGMAQRLKGVMEAIDVLGSLYEETDGLMVDHVVARLEGIANRCDQAATLIEQSGFEPKDTVPAAEGTRADGQTIRLLSHCLQLFGYCGAEIGESFPQFLDTIGMVADQVKEPSSDLAWLADFLARLFVHLKSAAGENPVPVVDQFDWVEGQAGSGVKSSFFGGAETVSIGHRLLAPFWVARVCFSQQSGLLFKKGQAAESLLLLEAGRRGGECFVLPPGDHLINRIQEATGQPRNLGGATLAAVPVVTKEVAAKKLKTRLAGMAQFAGGYADLQTLAYLPVAFVRYTGKNGNRTLVLTPVITARLPPFEILSGKIGSKKISFIQ